MKKLVICLLTVLMVAAVVTGCGNGNNEANDDRGQEAGGEARDQLKIVATNFPQYDWVRQILGDEIENTELTLLLDNGVDLHSYQPSTEDIAAISSCDMFIYNGGESDAWVEDALETATNDDMAVINTLAVVGDSAKQEEIIEGMEDDHHHESEGSEHAEEHDKDHTKDEHTEHHEDEGSPDEHVWLSLRHAQTLCSHIANQLGKVDPDNAEEYTENVQLYNEELASLDIKYQQVVDEGDFHTLVFADRFPFRYMVDDYGLDYYAAFPGCSAETESSFETNIFLAEKVNELGLRSIMVIEGSDQSIAKTVVQNTETKDQAILVLNSLQSVTSSDVHSGDTYLTMMDDNLEVLKQALSA